MRLSAALPLVVAGLAAASVPKAQTLAGKVGFGLVVVWMLGEYGAERAK